MLDCWRAAGTVVHALLVLLSEQTGEAPDRPGHFESILAVPTNSN